MKESKEKEKINNSSQDLLESLLKERRIEENMKRQLEYSQMQQNNQSNFYPQENNANNIYSQRHLYDHRKEKQDTLINIIDKNLQIEYISEVKCIFIELILMMFFSILVFSQSLLILHNYKNYNEVLLSQIFSAFLFFNTFFLIVELYRDALRDTFRNKLFRLFSLFLTSFFICLSYSQIMNIYIIYNKILIRKEKCKNNFKFCEDTTVNNVILVLSVLHIIFFFIINVFPIRLGYRSIKVLFGCDLEVYQKQILENEKKNKKDENKNKDKNVLKDNSKNKNRKEHLKNE